MKPTYTKLEATKRLTPEFLWSTFETHSKSMQIPLTWLELLAYLEVLEEELEEKAKISSMWARLITLYKMKCRASYHASLKKDSNSLLRLYELEYVSADTTKGDEEWK